MGQIMDVIVSFVHCVVNCYLVDAQLNEYMLTHVLYHCNFILNDSKIYQNIFL